MSRRASDRMRFVDSCRREATPVVAEPLVGLDSLTPGGSGRNRRRRCPITGSSDMTTLAAIPSPASATSSAPGHPPRRARTGGAASARTACLCLAVTLVAFVNVASARPDESEKDRKTRSYALLKEGRARYDLGKFEQAIDLFERAFEVYPYPEALFNLGQAHRQLKHYERALFYFGSYIRNKPDAPNRAEVEGIVGELEALIAAQTASAEKPPAGTQEPVSPGIGSVGPSPGQPAPREEHRRESGSPTRPAALAGAGPVFDQQPSADERWYSDKAGWTLVGVGVIATAAGVGFLVHASDVADRAGAAVDEDEAVRLNDSSDRYRLGGRVAAVAGAAVAIAGVAKLAIHDGRAKTRAELAVGLGWVGVQGRF